MRNYQCRLLDNIVWLKMIEYRRSHCPSALWFYFAFGLPQASFVHVFSHIFPIINQNIRSFWLRLVCIFPPLKCLTVKASLFAYWLKGYRVCFHCTDGQWRWVAFGERSLWIGLWELSKSTNWQDFPQCMRWITVKEFACLASKGFGMCSKARKMFIKLGQR